MVIKGYHIDEINQVSEELKVVLEELGVDQHLALLGLCRCIVRTADSDDLDLACVLIDRFTEIGD